MRCVLCGGAAELRSLHVNGVLVATAEACDAHWAEYVDLANTRAHLVNAMTAAGCSRADADRVVDESFGGASS